MRGRGGKEEGGGEVGEESGGGGVYKKVDN